MKVGFPTTFSATTGTHSYTSMNIYVCVCVYVVHIYIYIYRLLKETFILKIIVVVILTTTNHPQGCGGDSRFLFCLGT